MGRLRGRVPELYPRGSLNYFYGVYLLVFLWPIILICLVHISYISGSFHICAGISWSRWTLLQRPMGRPSLGITPHDLQGAFLCMCGQTGPLKMSDMWSGQGPASSLNCPVTFFLEFQSTWSGFPMGPTGAHLPPALGRIFWLSSNPQGLRAEGTEDGVSGSGGGCDSISA